MLAISIPLSVFLMSASQILLCANWLWEGNFKNKFSFKKDNFILISVLALFLVHILWLTNSENVAYGLDDIRKKLPLLAIPLVIFTSNPLSIKQYKTLLLLYCCAVLGGTFFSFGRYILYGDSISYRDIVYFFSHIRFSINICFAVFIILIYMVKEKNVKKWHYGLCIALVVWFIYILTILNSYTGIIVIFLTLLLLLVRYLIYSKIRLLSFAFLVS